MWRLRKRATSLTILDILTQPAPRSSMPCFAHGLRARARFGKARQSAHQQKVAERREIRTPNLLQQCTLVGFEPTTSRRLLSGCSANCAIPPIPLFFRQSLTLIRTGPSHSRYVRASAPKTLVKRIQAHTSTYKRIQAPRSAYRPTTRPPPLTLIGSCWGYALCEGAVVGLRGVAIVDRRPRVP